MPFDFSNKNVLISGACGGIGVELCRYYLEAGARVCALDKDGEKLQALLAAFTNHGERVLAAQADITDLSALQQALPALDFDVLIANAGMAHALSLKNTQPEQWHNDIDVNVHGTYHCVTAVLPGMQRRRCGVIVIIGSVNSAQALGHPGYSAAKAALAHYTKSLAMEYGRFGIRVNMVSPGTVKTQAWHARREKNPRVFDALLEWYPLRTFAEPLDVAHATAFLASDLARVITGSILPVDAGLSAGNRMLAHQLTLEDF